MNGTPPALPVRTQIRPSSGGTPPDVTPPSAKNLLAVFPTVLTVHIADLLGSKETMLFAQTCHGIHAGVQEHFRQRLKPEHRTATNALEAFKNPQKRLDRYVPIDITGSGYLNDLHINDYMARQIAKGKYSIAEALQILAKNREIIKTARTSGRAADWYLNNSRHHASNLFCVESGLLNVDQYLNLSYAGLKALGWKGVQDYLASGELKPEKLNSMCEWASWMLGYPVIQAAIERHELTVDEVASFKDPEVFSTYLLGANKYLCSGLMSFAQAASLKFADFDDLMLPAVQYQLDKGKMTMGQMLALKSADRRKLTM